MNPDLKKRLGITILAFIVVGGIEVGYLMWSRRDTSVPKKQEPTYSSNLDDYVSPHKIVPYDLASAKKELVGKTVWVKSGNNVPYYRYEAHNVNFSREVGLLPPLAKLQVKDVVLARKPFALKPGQVVVVKKEIMAVFEKAGEPGLYAASIGTNQGDDYTFFVNDLLFYEDPHELYKHWPPEIWNAIDQHKAINGMSELQAGFALGTSGSVDSDKYGDRTIEFNNAGNPVTVTFEKNKAVQVTQGKAQ
jgi:hypothetical protein